MKRDTWGSKIGVVLAAAGCAVGLGNFLRFPGVVAQNGGGAFMIPYFIAFLFLALPLCWMEWAMGRFGGQFGHGNAPGVFDEIGGRKNKALKYMGILGVIGALGIFFYYVVIESWTFAYSVFALLGNYGKISDPGQMSAFFNNYVSGEGPYFNSRWPAYICFLVTFACNFLIVCRGVSKGIEKFCKIAMPLLFIMAVFLMVRIFTLDAPIRPEWDVNKALGFLWNPDFSVLKSGRVWLEAASQVFFSTSVGIGVLLTYATYLKKDDDAVLPATTSIFLNEFAEIVLGASIVVPAAFLFFGPAGTEEAVQGGTFSLAFKTTPLIFNQMAGGPIVGFAWFFLLFIAGVTSVVSILQPSVAFLEDELGFDRKRSIILLVIIGFIVAHLVIFGDGVLDEMDFWFSIFGLPMFALLETIVFLFAMKPQKGWEEIKRGSSLKLPEWFKYIVCYVAPLFLLCILVSWLCTDGWKTIIMKKEVDGVLVPLYTAKQLPWVIATRIFYFTLVGGFCWLVHIAWKAKGKQK